jgi:hypothetical protein
MTDTFTFREIKMVVRNCWHESKQGRESGDYFRGCDRSNAALYFINHPKILRTICKYFQSIKDVGGEVVHVDICGRASAEVLGASKSYCFSLLTPRERKMFSSPENVFIDGDIFSTKDFTRLVKRLKQDSVIPSLVTFEPVAGLQKYNFLLKYESLGRAVLYNQLEKRLRVIINILRPGGYIFMGRAFQGEDTRDFINREPLEQYEKTLFLKRITKDLKCSVQAIRDPYGPYYLIRKHLKKGRSRNSQK